MSWIINATRPPNLTNETGEDIISNATEYGCGNPRFTVQEWTMVNLPVAATIIIFFGYFQPRVRLFPGCCKGRPSIAYPVNLLDSYADRLAFVCAFGITCIGILDLFTGNYYVEPNYDELPTMVQGAVRSCMAYVNVLAIGLAHYPIMICLTIQQWFVSDVIGILYTLEWAFLYYYSLAECPWSIGDSGEGNVNSLILLPIYLCYIILLIIFIKRMYNNYMFRKKERQGLEVEIHDYEEDFVKTHFYRRVKYLLTPKEEWERDQKEPKGCRKFWNKFYKDEPGFLFSRRIVCTIGLSGLCLYCIGIIYEASSIYLERWAAETFALNGTLYEFYASENDTSGFYTIKDIGDTFAYTFSPTTFAAMGTMICYNMVTFIAYRRNTLRLWRGDRTFCPKEDFANTTLVVSSLKYSGYHIAFILWGFILLQLTLWLLSFLVIYLLILPIINDEPNWVWRLIRNQWLSVVVYLCVYYYQVISAKFMFLQSRGKELSINNRRLFHVHVYFFFFVNVIIGFASCLLRIFKSVLFGLLLVGRIDRCLLMRGFELYDSGYKAYLGFLHLEVVHTHPVMITFCHYLIKAQRDRKSKVFEFSEDEEVDIPLPKSVNLRARNRWHLVYTLLRNNRLLAERFNAILVAKREEIKRQLEEERKKKDEGIVKDAVNSFVNDDAVGDDGVVELGKKSKKGCDGVVDVGGDLAEETERKNSSNFKLKTLGDGDDERQVLLGNTPKNSRTNYNAIHPKDKKLETPSMVPANVKTKDERETNFMVTTSDYGASSELRSPPDSTSPSRSGSMTKSWSTISIPESLQMTPQAQETPKQEGEHEAENVRTKNMGKGISNDGASSAPKISQKTRLIQSEESPLVIEDEEVSLPGTPTRTSTDQ